MKALRVFLLPVALLALLLAGAFALLTMAWDMAFGFTPPSEDEENIST